MVPEFCKLGFSYFDGSADPMSWLVELLQSFFLSLAHPEERKVGLASFYIEGNAQLLFLKVDRDCPPLDTCSNKLGGVAKLKHTGMHDTKDGLKKWKPEHLEHNYYKGLKC
ncbi:hypothetical protein M5689_011415 [Euphorbia peplus]|nr:hypothetical protein M5689_011415 [Euphorbia peplus]